MDMLTLSSRELSQNKLFMVNLLWSLPGRALGLIVLCIAFCVLSSPANANLASRQSVSYKVQFENILEDPFRQLDWSAPSTEMTFDIPDNAWINSLSLTLKAKPQGKVIKNSPLMVQFNDAAPIPIRHNGFGFSGKIRLDKRALKVSRNKIRVIYTEASGAKCLNVGDGIWLIDAKDSHIDISAKTKSQAFHINNVKERLSADATRPKSVSIRARGTDKTKFELLVAQGISHNIQPLPIFKTDAGGAMEIRVGTRGYLSHYIEHTELTEGTGPQIIVTRNYPIQLVITGDSDLEVMQAAKAFAKAPLPYSRRNYVTAAEYLTAANETLLPKLSTGRFALHEVGRLNFDSSWAPLAKSVHFDVEDPAASYGELKLHLNYNDSVAPSSKLKVDLNGQRLNTVTLDKTSKKIRIDIPQGLLQALNNKMTFTPALEPANHLSSCSVEKRSPGFSIGYNSQIRLEKDYTTPATDLSRFSAMGTPFSTDQGKNTVVILTGTSKAEKQASFDLIAHLVRVSGHGWSEAEILTEQPNTLPTNKNVLFIGPNIRLRHIPKAPRGLETALGQRISQTPRIVKTASTDVKEHILQTRETVRGGVAGLFLTPDDNYVGIITNMPGHYFSTSIKQLTKDDHWNELEGSVVRWNGDTVLMAQTAYKAPEINKPKLGFANLPKVDLNVPNIDWTLPEMNWANLKWPELKLPKIDLETPKLSNLLVKTSKVATVPPGNLSVNETVPTPRLKPPVSHNISSLRETNLPSQAKTSSGLFKIWENSKAWVGHTYGKLSLQLNNYIKRFQFSDAAEDSQLRPNLFLITLIIVFLLLVSVLIKPKSKTP